MSWIWAAAAQDSPSASVAIVKFNIGIPIGFLIWYSGLSVMQVLRKHAVYSTLRYAVGPVFRLAVQYLSSIYHTGSTFHNSCVWELGRHAAINAEIRDAVISLATIPRPTYMYMQLFLVSHWHVLFLFSCSSSWYPRQCFHTAILPPALIFPPTQKAKQCTFLHRWQNFSSGYSWTGLFLTPFLVWWLPNHYRQAHHRTNSLANALSAKWNIGLYLILNAREIEYRILFTLGQVKAMLVCRWNASIIAYS